MQFCTFIFVSRFIYMFSNESNKVLYEVKLDLNSKIVIIRDIHLTKIYGKISGIYISLNKEDLQTLNFKKITSRKKKTEKTAKQA